MSSRDTRTEPFADSDRVVAEIADDLDVPIDVVSGVYRHELAKIAAQARIRQFIVILAVRRTREILRQRQGSVRREPPSRRPSEHPARVSARRAADLAGDRPGTSPPVLQMN